MTRETTTAPKQDGQHRRARGALGAVSLRVVLALGASTGLTAAVALPMAYQAHEARREAQQPAPSESPQVLGTVTERHTDVTSEGLVWVPEGHDGAEPVALHGATISGPGRVRVELDDVDRVDLRLVEGEVTTSTEPPHDLDLAVPLEPGGHTLTATVSFDDGTVALRQADFSVE